MIQSRSEAVNIGSDIDTILKDASVRAKIDLNKYVDDLFEALLKEVIKKNLKMIIFYFVLGIIMTLINLYSISYLC